MDRYTRKDADRAFTALVAVVHYVDPALADRLVLEHGSPSCGRAWRLYERTDGGGLRTALGLQSEGYLGWSAREAVLTMRAITSALEWVAHPIYGRLYDIRPEVIHDA